MDYDLIAFLITALLSLFSFLGLWKYLRLIQVFNLLIEFAGTISQASKALADGKVTPEEIQEVEGSYKRLLEAWNKLKNPIR